MMLQSQSEDGMIPAFFAYVNPNTNVPTKSAWFCCVLLSIPAFFMNLEQITKVCSCCCLFLFSIATACGVALRYREHETQTTVRSTAEKYIWIYTLLAFLASLFLVKYT